MRPSPSPDAPSGGDAGTSGAYDLPPGAESIITQVRLFTRMEQNEEIRRRK